LNLKEFDKPTAGPWGLFWAVIIALELAVIGAGLVLAVYILSRALVEFIRG
jgi:hypothetical protein